MTRGYTEIISVFLCELSVPVVNKQIETPAKFRYKVSECKGNDRPMRLHRKAIAIKNPLKFNWRYF